MHIWAVCASKAQVFQANEAKIEVIGAPLVSYCSVSSYISRLSGHDLRSYGSCHVLHYYVVSIKGPLVLQGEY